MLCILFFVLLVNNFPSNRAKRLKAEKIIDGYLVKEHQLKYVAAVMYIPQNEALPDQNPCSGAIISDSHIATAALCFYHQQTRELIHQKFYVAVSILDLQNKLESTKYIQVDLVYFPRTYNSSTLDTYSKIGNLAIVKLVTNLGLRAGHPYLRKLRLGRDLSNTSYDAFVVAGYGWNIIIHITDIREDAIWDGYFGESDGKLRSADAEILDLNTCQDEIIHDRIAADTFCAKIKQETYEHKGICQGDSGAPLVRGNYLVGLAIHGFAECNENRLPGIYISVPYYRNFITNAINDMRAPNMRILQLKNRDPNVFIFEEQ